MAEQKSPTAYDQLAAEMERLAGIDREWASWSFATESGEVWHPAFEGMTGCFRWDRDVLGGGDEIAIYATPGFEGTNGVPISVMLEDGTSLHDAVIELPNVTLRSYFALVRFIAESIEG